MTPTPRRLAAVAAAGIAAAALLVPSAPATASPPAHGVTTAAGAAARAAEDDSRAALRAAMEAVVDAGATGVNAMVDDGDDVTRLAVGLARLDPSRRLHPQDQARVGSITKTVIAVVALQLAHEGKLDLEDSIEEWLPGMVPGGSAITLRMLLNHTSGIFNYTDDPDFFAKAFTDPYRAWTPRELIDLALGNPPLFRPGTSWSYSNTGYILLGLALEKASGTSVADLVKRRVTRPLHLEDTYFATTPRFRGSYARGYIPPGIYGVDTYTDTSGWTPTWAWAAGALVSNTKDLTTFYQALLSGDLLSRAQLREMTTTVTAFPGAGYGLGIFTVDTPCGAIWGHTGGIPGYVTISYHDRAGTRSTLLVLSTEPDEAIANKFEELVLQAVCSMFGKPVPAAATTAPQSAGASGWTAPIPTGLGSRP
jgi:D-alanyl-D-alanine carboxypeptidase